jgi:iron(III) transport system substrate-binding protein
VPSAIAAQESSPVAVGGGTLVIYCGRNEELIGALVPDIEAATGLTLDVRYGNTAELAAQILEEGDNSPAGLYFGQDAGSLGALAKEGRLAALPEQTLDQVDARFRSPEGLWVGLSGRARVLVYNPNVTDPATLPATIAELPAANVGSLAWAPTNASFQTFVTALRVLEGEDAARAWLEAMIEAGTETYEGNGQIRDAVANEEVAIGLVNHYYLYQARKENPEIAAENYYFPDGDLGSLINVAGAGVISGSGQEESAMAVIDSFAQETSEYPLAAGVEPIDELPPLESFETPELDLTDLDDLAGTIQLLTEVGLI